MNIAKHPSAAPIFPNPSCTPSTQQLSLPDMDALDELLSVDDNALMSNLLSSQPWSLPSDQSINGVHHQSPDHISSTLSQDHFINPSFESTFPTARLSAVPDDPDPDSNTETAPQGPSSTVDPSDSTNPTGASSAPRRRTRRRQNISCDQCRASKRGCDFQLKLDADGNDVTQSSSSANPTAAKRKADASDPASSSKPGPVCSNCQRRGIECTTHFADSVRSSKQQALAAKELADPGHPTSSKKRVVANGDSIVAVRSGSVSSEAGSSRSDPFATGQSTSPEAGTAPFLSLSWHGVNSRFANRADSLSLTTNRMRLYVSTVEPNANLWLSRACSPLRSEGDLGAFIKSAIATNALHMSQKLWASWHVDTASTHRDHQPNLFYLVFGLDHLGEELGVWGENLKKQHIHTMNSNASIDPNNSIDDAISAAHAGFIERVQELTGNGPDGWRRSERDLLIDDAVKAAMLAYACQYRLDGSSVPEDPNQAPSQGDKDRDAHDRVATAAWKKARSLLFQLAPRRSCRVAYGLFLFGVTAPPAGAVADGLMTGSDAAEDAAFACETASRHLEWFLARCRELVRSVEDAAKNPLLASNPDLLKQRRLANDLMGLAESLGWFGLLIDTVSSVSLKRKSAFREDTLVDEPSGLSASLFGGFKSGESPASSLSSSSPTDQSTAALFAIQETLELLPGRQAPPGAFPGTSMSYMHDDTTNGDDGLPKDSEMSKRILERAACARDLIPALLRNPSAISNAMAFDVLLPGSSSSNGVESQKQNFANSIFFSGGSTGLSEQVVLLGIAWGTAVEVYIWRRINTLQTLSEPLLSSTSPFASLKGSSFISDKKERLISNVLDTIRLFHSIFDGLISKAYDEYFLLSRQARSMLAMFVIHIHLGVLHFIRLTKDMEQKEAELVQLLDQLKLDDSPTTAASGMPTQTDSAMPSLSPNNGVSIGSQQHLPSRAGQGSTVKPRMTRTSLQRRIVGREAAAGVARVAKLLTIESSMRERISKQTPSESNNSSTHRRKNSLYMGNDGRDDIEDSATAPWRHPYPILAADALQLAAQQLHDEVWDQLLTIPRNNQELTDTLGHLDTCLDSLTRLLHSVPALESYRKSLHDLKNARDTAAYVATQQ